MGASTESEITGVGAEPGRSLKARKRWAIRVVVIVEVLLYYLAFVMVLMAGTDDDASLSLLLFVIIFPAMAVAVSWLRVHALKSPFGRRGRIAFEVFLYVLAGAGTLLVLDPDQQGFGKAYLPMPLGLLAITGSLTYRRRRSKGRD